MGRFRVMVVVSALCVGSMVMGCRTADDSASRHAEGSRSHAAALADPVAEAPASRPSPNDQPNPFVDPPRSAKAPRPTTTSAAGADFIKRHEGLRLKPYRDASGVTTIGYGHRVLPNESRRVVTRWEADHIFNKDLAAAECAVNDGVDDNVLLTQSQYDALVSFVYNVGPTAFRNSTLLAAVNRRDLTAATAEFRRWTHAGPRGRTNAGLVARRAEEADMFEGGE